MPQRSHTVVLMSDTHTPWPLPRQASALHYSALAAIANAHYACLHGYDFQFVRLVEDGCAHHVFGHRHPSYCKLPGIAAALRRWRTVVFVDSDSWFVADAPPVEELLAAYGTGNSSLYLAWDWPYSNGPNCGFMVWRNSTRAVELLATWWHLDTGPFAAQHDYEQRAMYWGVANLRRFRGAIETLRIAPLAAEARSTASPVVHVDHTRKAARYWQLSLAILALVPRLAVHQAVDARRSQRRGELGRDELGHAHPSDPALSPHANATLIRLEAAARLLADDSLRGTAGGLKRLALKAALAAIKLLTRTARYPAATVESPAGAAASAAASAAAGAAERGRRHGVGPRRWGEISNIRLSSSGALPSRRLGACMRVRPLNATSAALKWLSPRLYLGRDPTSSSRRGVEPRDGDRSMASALMRMSAAGRTTPSETVTSEAPSSQLMDSMRRHPPLSALAASLEGMPLVLRRCDPANTRWQLWTHAPSRGAPALALANHTLASASAQHAIPTLADVSLTRLNTATPSTARSEAGHAAPDYSARLPPINAEQVLPQLRLAAHPHLCVTVGPDRAIREPFLPLAQLMPCAGPQAPGMDGIGSTAAGPAPGTAPQSSADAHADSGDSGDRPPRISDGWRLRMQLSWMAEARVWRTSGSLWDLHQNGQLTSLLGVHGLWPDDPRASLRSNPHLFWPAMAAPDRETRGRGHTQGRQSHLAALKPSSLGARSPPSPTVAVGPAAAHAHSTVPIGLSAAREQGDVRAPTKTTVTSTAATSEGQRDVQRDVQRDHTDEHEHGEDESELATLVRSAEQGIGYLEGEEELEEEETGPNGPSSTAVQASSGLPTLGRRLLELNGRAAGAPGPRAPGVPRAGNDTSFLGWARAGNRSGRAVSAFVAKQRRWRQLKADPKRLWTPCTSEYSTGDKNKQDCETWCRP